MRPAGRANISSAIEEAPPTMKVEMSVDDWEKWSKFKEMCLEDKQSIEASTTSTSAASANFGGTWDWKKAWDREHA